jgi:hypothetical protein
MAKRRRPDHCPEEAAEGPSLNNKPFIVERRSLDFAALRSGFARDDGKAAAAQRLLTGHLGG